MRIGRRRGGFTLLETMVAVAIGLMVLGILLRITIFGVHTLAGVQGHLDALHAAQMQLERIGQDLHHLFVQSAADLSILADKEISGPASAPLVFRSTELGPGRLGPVYVGMPIEYRAVPAGDGTFFLARNGETSIPLRIKSLRLEPVVCPSLGGRMDLHFVRIALVAVDPDRRESLAVVGLAAIDLVTLGRRDRFANPNPDDAHPALALAQS